MQGIELIVTDDAGERHTIAASAHIKSQFKGVSQFKLTPGASIADLSVSDADMVARFCIFIALDALPVSMSDPHLAALHATHTAKAVS
jgi:hypothetical protein